jgi:uncharacterized protein YutE (UPF0331/DUF86 family)
MNTDVIYYKLEILKRYVDRIKSKTPHSSAELAEMIDCQDIILMNLQRSVKICVDIAAYILANSNIPPPMTMQDAFYQLNMLEIISKETFEKMQRSVGFRNIAIHEYDEINWEIVFSILCHHVDDFKAFAKEIFQWVESKPDNQKLVYRWHGLL